MNLAEDLTVPGDFQPGWQKMALPPGWEAPLANGLYDGVLESFQDGKGRQATGPVRIYVLK